MCVYFSDICIVLSLYILIFWRCAVNVAFVLPILFENFHDK